MLSIVDGGSLARVLKLPIDAQLKSLLIERRDQLGCDIAEIARFWIIQPGDSLAALDEAVGFSVFQNLVDGSRFGDPDFTPSWEWVADHGFCFEMVFIMDDSGFGHVVLVEKAPDVDARLITLCETYAAPYGQYVPVPTPKGTQ